MRTHWKQRKAWMSLAWLMLLSAAGMSAAQAAGRTLLVMGDSLSAGYGLASPEQGWVARLDARLKARDPDWRVVNASVSGETTGGGAARLPRALKEHAPSVVIVELGANDALRGLPLTQAETHLRAMVEAARASGARVLLVGMEIPPNYGPDYADAFRTMFATVARDTSVALLPFLLAPIATDLSQFQADGVHPTAQAQPVLLDHLWPALEPLLD